MSDYDFDTLKKLAYDACIKTYDLYSEIAPEQLGTRITTVYRPKGDSGMTGLHALFPRYQSSITLDKFNEVWNSEENIKFLTVLSECPLLPDHMAFDSSNVDSWMRMQAMYLIQNPLHSALDKTAMINFIDGSDNPEAWALEKEYLIDSINSSILYLIEYPANNVHYIKAICPIFNIEFNANEIILSKEIKIKEWSTRDRAILMSSHHDAFLWQDDFGRGPTFSKYFIEMELNVKAGASPHEAIASNIDCIKWAAMTAANSENPPSEGVCIVLTKGGTRLNSIRREDSLKGEKYSLNQQKLDTFISLFYKFNNSVTKNYGLDKALWHFGRSCTSSIQRDILLEAVIGIDSIVSSDSRDSFYRFCLHGSALLKANDSRIDATIYEELKQIYGRRSSAAHGTGPIANKQSDLHEKARLYLSKMIESVLILNENKTLSIDKDNEVAKAVQVFVINKVLN